MNDTLLNSRDVKIKAAVGQEGRGKILAGKCQSLWITQPNNYGLLCPFYHSSLAHQRHVRFWSSGSPGWISKPSLHQTESFGANESWAPQLARLWLQQLGAALSQHPAVPGVIAENLHRVCFLQQQKEWWCLWSQSHLRLACVSPTQLSSAWEAFCAHFSYHRDCKAPPSSITPDASDSLLMLFSIYPP